VRVRACVRPSARERQSRRQRRGRGAAESYLQKSSLFPNDSPRQRERHNLLFLSLTTNEKTPRAKKQTPETPRS
jgi:hypothetical protein